MVSLEQMILNESLSDERVLLVEQLRSQRLCPDDWIAEQASATLGRLEPSDATAPGKLIESILNLVAVIGDFSFCQNRCVSSLRAHVGFRLI